MATYDYVDGNGDMATIWTHPDAPTIEEIIEHDGILDFECPADDCDTGFQVQVDDEADLGEMVAKLKNHNGTLECTFCNEPVYGLYGDGNCAADNGVQNWLDHELRR